MTSLVKFPKISGFTLVRNGVEFDYPFLESLRSLLPLVDELIVNVGVGTDQTLKQIQDFAREEGYGKVFYFESDWKLNDPERKRGGKILSEQTNLALERCSGEWCLYLQADEVLHEADYDVIRRDLADAHVNKGIDALVFHYRHLYGSYDVIQESRSVYRREVRAIRRLSGAQSVGDAQSFRRADGSKLIAQLTEGRVFHYGWVRTPEQMREKTFFMDQLYHGDADEQQVQERRPHTGDNYRYKRFWGLKRYTESHPAVMSARIKSKNWSWDLESSPWVWELGDLKKLILDAIERWTGHRLFEYRSYRLR